MKKDFTPENFERFLKDNADGLRMRPADSVWNRIENHLNRRRRWVYLTSGFFLLTASLFGYLIVDQSKQPSDPFAGIHTIEKNTAVSTTTTTPATAGTNSAATASPFALNQKPGSDHLSKASLAAALFQKPMSALLNADATTEVSSPEFTLIPTDELQPVKNTATTPKVQQSLAQNEVPPGIENVVNSYQPKLKRHKSEFQLYFTPTISYRRLTENKSYLQAVPQNLATYSQAALYNVNSMVTHRPDMGLEFGFAFKFPVSTRLKLRTGMQFNITRYSIRAFTYVPERTTIALNNRNRGIDSVNTISSYRNFNGNYPDWLQNFYFQVSAPIGLEVSLTPAAKKTRFGIATSFQPTYVLGDRAYLLSTDYKNYSQVPWLIRRWNVNTSLETFVTYSTGKLRWQVGPQIRYQLLSSFVEQYPVKENLFDFGMKVGVSLDKK